MLALCFRANGTRYAISAREVVEVLPRMSLRPIANAPISVRGLLPFRGMLIPVVDVSELLGGVGTSLRFSSRLIVVEIKDGRAPARLVALQADDVTDLVRSERTEPGLTLPFARYLGEHLVDVEELPQLLNASQILPEELRALFLDNQGNSVDLASQIGAQ